MATFISVPLKKSSEVDLVKPLSKFVTTTYQANDEQAEYLRSVEELNKLRKNALGRPLDKHESSLEILLRYYDQLCAVEPKFPFSENQLCLTFTWKDAFEKGSLFGGSVKLALASLGYEKTCVLFNAAALASQIASEQNLDNDEGLRTAAKYYQLASGAFGHIKDTVLSALNREPTMDISPETVGTLSLIMLAQAQEVFFLKATSDRMKDAVIAKLANQAADFYGDAFKQYKDNLPKYFYFQEVMPVLAAKRCIMQANAELHQSAVAKQKKRFGEEIARLQHAAELAKTVASRYDDYVSVKDLSEKINRALTAAKKDNDFIYHDRVPEVKDLETIGKAALVKATSISPPLSQKFTDLFEKMVPMAVQQSMSIYSQRKAETVNRLVGSLREATNLCNGVLASLNLPAALEDLSGDSVPQSIAEKARSIVQQGGLQSIEQLIKDLPELLTRNREILDESLKMLDDEETTDNELRAKFNQRWNRTPSGDLYKPLRAEGANFRNVLDKAVQADQVVRDRYGAHCDMIALLCKSEDELSAAIPSANPTKTLQGSEVVNVLRSLLSQLDEMKKERDTLEEEIKAVTFDMSTSFLTALAQDGAINEEQLSLSQLDQSYGTYNQRVQASLHMQEELLGKVQTSHQDFSSLKQSNAETNQREEVLKKLASAHDSYVEISNNLREGTKFYNDLTEILLKFQNKCSDIVFARKTERDELLKDLQQSIAREPSAPSFNVPAYQSTPAAGPTPAPRTVFQPQPAQQQPPAKPQPPARPPPPTVTPQAAATPPPTNTAPSVASTSNPPPVAPMAQAQGPPYPTYQGYPGYFQAPMGYNPYAYGQYNMPNMPNMPFMPYQPSPGQGGYPGAPPAGQPYPGYPQQPPQQQQQHQPYYPQQ
ncbi:programmed cell death 6-interacting protein isoform X1 [Solea senegalensis]|uniref:Programmed cell death 6-interacting protein n=2 Tax=Solea senegalensis TaxID=28829 RepID=A0AAV6R423_SOLSE|nr:programmed cell death 6-interacting protein isoform X1 [Solea senegalensis]KAG7499878.1 programmed cell death 6-interacting protein isoform X1 [Solea senegalensis]